MTYAPLTQLIFVAGLAASTLIFALPDVARADVRPCTEEENALYDGDDEGLPALCDVMTVTAKRVEDPGERLARSTPRPELQRSEIKEDLPDMLAEVAWDFRATK